MRALRHPAMIIASLALFVALGGTSLAAASYINGKHIKPHSLPKNRLTKGAIESLHGAVGPRGVQGPKGDTGDIGPSDAWSAYDGSLALGSGYQTVASLTLGAGSYVVMAKTTLYLPTYQGTTCRLSDTVAGLIDQSTVGGIGATSVDATASELAPLTTNGSTVSVECGSNETDAEAYNTHLVAIKVGSVTGT